MNDSPIVAANWKMYKTPQEGYSFVENLKNKLLDKYNANIILCAPYTSLLYISELFENAKIELGAQNMHWASEGAYTGEISSDMLKASGVEWVILGHSERRHVFSESIELISKKVRVAVDTGLKPIFCIGETLDKREQGKTKDILAEQLAPMVENFSVQELSDMLFAYEPVWAIGTGVTAVPEQVEEAHGIVREIVGDNIRILYGGSVKPANANELISVKGVDGFLVGGASLDVDSFLGIIESV